MIAYQEATPAPLRPLYAIPGCASPLLDRVEEVIAACLSDVDFDVEALARLLYMSRPTFYRKIREVSALTPNELINNARLRKAAELLTHSDHTIEAIAHMAGFHSRSNFGQAFCRRYHMTPKELRVSRVKSLLVARNNVPS